MNFDVEACIEAASMQLWRDPASSHAFGMAFELRTATCGFDPLAMAVCELANCLWHLYV